MARRTDIDWDAIERAYRVGNKTNGQLATQFGVALSSIGRRAKQFGWVQDKREEVATTRESLLIQNASGNANPNATPTALEVKAAAEMGAQVVLRHRGDARRARDLVNKLLDEVEFQTDNLELFQRLGELLDETDTDDKGRIIKDQLNIIYRKVIDTPGRVDSIKKLVDTLGVTVKIEREAFSLDQAADEKTTVETLLERVARKQGYTT